MTPTATKTWYNDARHAVATQGHLLVQIWRGDHTLDHWAADMAPLYQ